MNIFVTNIDVMGNYLFSSSNVLVYRCNVYRNIGMFTGYRVEDVDIDMGI